MEEQLMTVTSVLTGKSNLLTFPKDSNEPRLNLSEIALIESGQLPAVYASLFDRLGRCNARQIVEEYYIETRPRLTIIKLPRHFWAHAMWIALAAIAAEIFIAQGMGII